jgi:uncharacterized protein (TIGR03083 family)
MPQDRNAAIRQDLVDAQHGLLEVLDRVGPDDWLRPSPNEGWTVRDLFIHLTTSESGFVGTLRRMAAGEGGVPVDFDPNRWNAGQLRRRGEMTVEQMRPELEAAHRDMLALLEGLDDAALDQRGHMSSGISGTTEDNFRLVASHKRSHTNDIRAALPTRVPS